MREDRPTAARALAGCALLAVLALAPAVGQVGGDGARMSRQMRMAIDQYKRGDDLGAMDRFMEVLVKGDPRERSMANDYLNRITQRMAGASSLDGTPPTGGVTEREPAPPVRAEPEGGVSSRAPVETYEPPAPVRAEGPGAPPDAEEPPPPDREPPPARTQGGAAEDRRVMKEEIDAKIKNRTREVLGSLRKWEEVQVRMANSRLPRAVGFPSSFVFDDGVRFKKESAKLLEALTELVFSLGATQVVILPEGALFNDAKIMDMRRTMAISSSLLKAGVAPSRLRVNLLSSQVDVPKDMMNWRGILILFVYNQPLNLASENELEAGGGPPVSLGVSPGVVDPREGEGSIVEFSVMEPPAGLMSWRFQLLAPGAKPDADMQVLQEVKGAAPVFHQVYWNARKRYFGDPLPPGRYECVLTATDMRNRTSRARQWVEVKGDAPAAAAAAAPGGAPPAELGRPPTDEELDPEEDIDRVPVAKKGRAGRAAVKGKTARASAKSRKGKPTRVRRRPAAVAAAEVPKAAETPAATGAAPTAPDGTAPSKPSSVELKGPSKGPAEDSGSRAMAVNYQVLFQKGTTNITKEGESILARVADTMHYYPLDNINLVGYAYTGEPDAAKLAGRRAETVSKLLVDRHGMKAERIRTDTKVSEDESFKVEIYIVEGQ